MVLLDIWRNMWHFLTKFGTQKHQGKKKSKFKLGDLDFILKVTMVIKWFSLSIWINILRSLKEFGTQKHQGNEKNKFELGDLDIIFKVTKVICHFSAQYPKKYLTKSLQIW